ncbi:MAG: glutamine--scyllo-inositol aminotransferase, partial [Clostridiales bacterium]|nr:glutamine--scyllo-inositol aminotransferase [Clostridiales bacterium]
MSRSARLKSLAINGGEKSIKCLLPDRSLLGEEEKVAINKLFDSAIAEGAAIGYNGPEEEQYTKEFAELMGGGYADAVNSGTTAVFVALKALNIEPFTEVIVSPITDPGGIMPIPMLNCIPVVADAAVGKYNTDAKEIEKHITPLTSAIVVAHIGGEPADIENIVALGKKHGIPVVEDCAQAHGAKLNGKLVGTFGDIAAISTMFGKHHSTGGQGGIVYTQREDLYWKIRQAADRGKPFGISNPNGNVMASLNFNLDEIGATIGRQQLKKLPEIVKRRRDVVERLKREFSKLDAIIIPEQLEGSEPSYWWWRLDVDEGKLNVTKREYCEALLA